MFVTGTEPDALDLTRKMSGKRGNKSRGRSSNLSMKRLAIIGTIAALAFSTMGQAEPQKEKKAKRQVTATQPASKSRLTAVAPTRNRPMTTVAPTSDRTFARRLPTRSRTITTAAPTRGGSFATVAPGGSRTVVKNYYGGGYYGGYYPSYYGGYYPYYSGYYPYYGGSSFSIGIGTGYPYGYGYGYPYGYGNPYYNSYYPSGGYSYGYSSSYNVVAEVQERLARYGYYHGSIDGEAGPLTRAAIARWEASHGMYADGRIDQQLLRSLGLS
jgi:Putative peptidoglycan binding domain